MSHRWKALSLAAAVVLSAALLPASAAGRGTTDATPAVSQIPDSSAALLTSNRFTHVQQDAVASDVRMNLEGYTLAAETDALALYVREESASLRIANRRSGYVWGALTQDKPAGLNQTWSAFANSIVSIEYFDDSGNLKKIGAGHRNATCRFRYEGRAVFCEVRFDKLDISLTAKVELMEDRIVFSVDDATVKEEGDYTIANLYFAPFLGSVVSDTVPGYMFVPDGCGALIRFDRPTSYLSGFSRRVYDLDYAIDNLYAVNNLKSDRPNDFAMEEEPITLPVYGIVHGVRQNALFGVIDHGAEYAAISATPAGMPTDYNWAAVGFLYRQLYQQPVTKSGAGVQIVQRERNEVNPQLSVYLLEGDEADYVGMARLYSDRLTAQGALPAALPADTPKLALDFLMADIQQGFLVSSTKTITTLPYLQTVVQRLESAGIADVHLTLLGWQPGGLNGYRKSGVSDRAVFGSFEGLRQLQEALSGIRGTLSLYIDPFRAKQPQISERRDAGISLSQSPIKLVREDTTVYLGDTWLMKLPAALATLQKQAAVLRQQGLGAPVVDGGALLYGDYLQAAFHSRRAVREEMETVYAQLAAAGGLTLFTPNAYLLAYTAQYRDAPMSSSQYLYETDTVPFLQIALSGKVALYAPYANESFYSQTDVLKCIEYNCYPTFLLTEAANHTLKKTAVAERSTTCYADWEGLIGSLYEQIVSVLTPVRGQRIVGHTVVEEGLVEVTYEDGGRIGINYRTQPYTLDGVVIPATQAVYIPPGNPPMNGKAG